MKLSYHAETDSLYVGLSDKPGADVVIVAEGFVVDVDEQGRPVGIDIDTNASSVADLSRLELEGLSLGGITAGLLAVAPAASARTGRSSGVTPGEGSR